MNRLPDDVLRNIIDFAFICKKEQNFYINKRLLKLSKEKVNCCMPIVVFKKNICINCHKEVFKFFNYYYCTEF